MDKDNNISVASNSDDAIEFKLIETKQSLLLLDKQITEHEKKKEKILSVLSELLKKLNQLNYLKETDKGKYSNDDPIEKEKLIKKLDSYSREHAMVIGILKQQKHKYESSQLYNGSPYSRENLNNLIKANSDLRIKVKETKIKNTLNMKEIENLQHSSHYQTIISNLQNELRQLIFKVNEHNAKVAKHEKSINIMKGIFLSLIKEKTSELLQTEKGQVFIRDHRLEDLKILLQNDQYSLDEIIKVLSVQLDYLLNTEENRTKRSKPKTQQIKSRDKLFELGYKAKSPNIRTLNNKNKVILQPLSNKHKGKKSSEISNSLLKSSKSSPKHANEEKDYNTCSNTEYQSMIDNYNNMISVLEQVNKTYNLQEKIFKKKLNDAIKIKEVTYDKLTSVKEENNLLSKEIELLNQQLNNLN